MKHLLSNFILVFVVGHLYAQNCPSLVTRYGYVVLQYSKTHPPGVTTKKSGDTTYFEWPTDQRDYPMFVPMDSISKKRPLSYWIGKGDMLPAVYSLWDQQDLRYVLYKQCGSKYPHTSLLHGGPQPEKEALNGNYYDIADSTNGKWFYRIYYLEAQWWNVLLTEKQKKQFYFMDRITPVPPVEGQTPYFGLHKVLKYTADFHLNDKKIRSYRIATTL